MNARQDGVLELMSTVMARRHKTCRRYKALAKPDFAQHSRKALQG